MGVALQHKYTNYEELCRHEVEGIDYSGAAKPI
ncbi:hypothetical protein XINFAN_00119 [Pseudogemmobacter humi]|uniref:Uncharacterized protein n=1 Tax=Pseudogemmobacter humi TaxID=2483812 RepID=A0A3P5WKU3_9RHOB|nr:hypothetical protein XINFAN_00119 [Pseudogemmobacter humi]